MPPPSLPLLRSIGGALACVGLLAGCETQTSEPQPVAAGDIRSFVTAEVAGQLTPDGRFPPRNVAPEPYPQISHARAAEIALAWARTYGRFFRPYLERDYGRRIDFGALTVVSPVWYAAAVYEPMPPEAHVGSRNAFGPHYLLYLGHGGEPVLGVSVAAFAQSYLRSDGRLADHFESGNEVIAYGVPPAWGFSLPVSAEQAVRIAAAASGARAAEAPELLNPHRDYHPYHAHWKVVLERPVTVREHTTGAKRLTRELYVGRRGQVLVAAETQEETADRIALKNGATITLRRRPEHPVTFHTVDIISQ